MTQSPPSNQPQSLPAIWSDIVLWVVILVMIGAAGFWLYFNDTNQRQTISLPFRDANEMTVGANVRMMGTEIGYVEDIQLKDGHVDVRIKTEAGMVPIPPGSRATILFTGLGGAKSVEIDPPREFNLLDYRTLSNRHHLSDTGIIVEEPIRQKDNNKYMVDIAESLRDGARNFYKVFGQGSVQQTSKNVRLSTIRTQKAINALKQTNKEFDASLNAYKQIQPHFFTMLTQLNNNTAMVADVLNQKLLGPTAYH